ncbi:hypothetical protein L211DRAFT_854243 [Terfezia boudieri ATCC MYA-4762]|uniref:Uncharacterized protein n=1 Tax=Terfezia boudieri ATCC MYA-4762 TaxID=1051890 RepID=A0A3N4L6U7_9PEZI|nr:hypothetical protein L211DRAFT_854243 [Terfezia boudieri ATCC MYA-4762]
MVMPKNLIQNSKADLGWDTRDADYTSWRNAVKEYCARHSIHTWGVASQAEKDALVIATRALTGFSLTIRDRLVSGSNFYKKALEALLQDCLKKRSETAKNLSIKHAQKRVHTNVVSDGDDEVPDGENKPIAMLFWVGDPDVGANRDINGWIWDERARRNIAEIRLMTLYKESQCAFLTSSYCLRQYLEFHLQQTIGAREPIVSALSICRPLIF